MRSLRTPVLLAGLAIGVPAFSQSVPTVLQQCDRTLCGNLPQNVATMAVTSGTVSANANGSVSVSLVGLRTAAGARPFTTLTVQFGSFTNGAWSSSNIGTITTDGNGNFTGNVMGFNGSEVVLGTGNFAGSFIFNDAQRSQFISGFRIGTPPVKLPVPNVVGLEKVDLQGVLGANFKCTYTGSGAADSEVTSQSPLRDQYAYKGSTVTVTTYASPPGGTPPRGNCW